MILKNTFANLIGQVVYPILSFFLVPFYIRNLGLEGYGLISFLTLLVVIMGAFTKGLSSALQREIAGRTNNAKEKFTLRSFIVTFEIVYWIIGFFIATILIFSSKFIATYWLNISYYSKEIIYYCIILIGIRIATALPNSVYQAVFIGMEKQVKGNILNAIIALVTSLSGVIAVLYWKSVMAFYISDLICAIIALLILRYGAKTLLPPKKLNVKDKFDFTEIKKIWRMGLGMLWAHGAGLVLSNLDRLIISKIFPLASLGIYQVGMYGGGLLSMIYTPFMVATYPQTCHISRQKDISLLNSHLLNNFKIILIGCLTFGLPLAFFASDFLYLWTHNKTIVVQGTAILSIFVISNIFAALAGVFYQGQWALGITHYVAIYHTFGLIWLPITIWYFVHTFGLVGAAWAWLIYQVGGFIYNYVTMNMILSKSNYLHQYIKIFLFNFVLCFFVMYLCYFLAFLCYSNAVIGRILFAILGSSVVALISIGNCYGFKEMRNFIKAFAKYRNVARN